MSSLQRLPLHNRASGEIFNPFFFLPSPSFLQYPMLESWIQSRTLRLTPVSVQWHGWILQELPSAEARLLRHRNMTYSRQSLGNPRKGLSFAQNRAVVTKGKRWTLSSHIWSRALSIINWTALCIRVVHHSKFFCHLVISIQGIVYVAILRHKSKGIEKQTAKMSVQKLRTTRSTSRASVVFVVLRSSSKRRRS